MAHLYKAVVVLGAGLSASSCGGETSGTGRVGEGGTGGTGLTSGSGGATGGGGTFSIGGMFTNGGTTASAGGGASLPEPGTLAQWDCAGNLQCSCSGEYRLSAACVVDSARPRGLGDCGPGETFECIGAQWVDGTELRVNCACRAGDAGAEGCACVAADGSLTPADCPSPSTRVCLCARTCIVR